jgi:hypothetical protein
MATATSGSRPSVARLIFIPSLISLAVTVLRTDRGLRKIARLKKEKLS